MSSESGMRLRDLWTEILGPVLLRDEMGLLTEHCDQLEPHFVIQINSLCNYRWKRCQDSLTRAKGLERSCYDSIASHMLCRLQEIE